MNMTPEEEAEALRMAEIAKRAEMKAAAKNTNNYNGNGIATSSSSAAPLLLEKSSSNNEKPVAAFLTKKEREQLALERLAQKRLEQEQRTQDAVRNHQRFVTGEALQERKREERDRERKEKEEREKREKVENKPSIEHDHEVKAIREHYLGGQDKKRRVLKPSEKFAKLFEFEWEPTEDTSRNDVNPLYANRVKINALFGRGYIAGVDPSEQRKKSNFLTNLSEKRLAETRRIEEADDRLTAEERIDRGKQRDRAIALLRQKQSMEIETQVYADTEKAGTHWTTKSLDQMTERDWRIFREDFDIRIKGGRATLPLRHWSEANFPEIVMKAIVDAGYEKPSPIQRQAIPIGQARKDIIGIAETGSGKTAAFLIPLLIYMTELPIHFIQRAAEEGPLAIVMAPTRELAQQIEEECIKLARHTTFKTACIVGGQSIEEQGFQLRQGVEIAIGTPGRMVDCIENNYLVLNQCNYVVLDEADRMVDMGFEPQVVAVLDAMGGLLKSEDERLAEEQAKGAQAGESLYRVTAMFSATMPPEVERIAKTYLRHPVVIKIGDEDTGKNKRIEQRVMFVTEGQKRSILNEELRRMGANDKIIIFINSKKQGDVIGKILDAASLRAGVLHGGKSQDQREDTLEKFRSGEVRILVATDVAGRGLDIADVTHVVNYDMPNKIANYCHRIGRTGRAGKSGIATTFITDEDAEVMYDLKAYLESCDAAVPPQLAKHPQAQAPYGTRDDKGNVVGSKRDSIQYSKK